MSGMIQIIDKRSIIQSILLCVFMIISVNLNGQADKKFIRKGNKEYEKGKYSDSEISYRKAVDNNKQSPDAVFNVGDALYKQDKFEEAGKQFIENTNQNEDKIKKSAGLYNLGNSLLKANKIQESIDAYKNSLKLLPGNKEAKYNLSYAQDLLKQQQEQQKKQQQDKDKQDQKQQQQQPQQQEISKDDAERLLNSLANDEKNVEEKVKLAKAAKAKVRTVKNW